MNLGIYPIASSSKGNCYLIRSEETIILLDAGIAGISINTALKTIELSYHAMDGLLLTHEHIDHVRSSNSIMKYSKHCEMFCSSGTWDSISGKIQDMYHDRVNIVEKNQTFMVGDIEVTTFALSHDAAEPISYSFSKGGKKISVITDTGKMTKEMDEVITDSDVLVIESNHEVNVLLYGRYPYLVKRRILSDVGHLSNESCGEAIVRFLKNQTHNKIPYVLLAHLSQENNTPEQAMLTVKNVLEENEFYVGRDLRMSVLKHNENNEYIII